MNHRILLGAAVSLAAAACLLACSGSTTTIVGGDGGDGGGSSGSASGGTSSGSGSSSSSGGGSSSGGSGSGSSSGSGSGGGTCSLVADCGGDVTGSWKATNGCVNPVPAGAGVTGCPGATEQVTEISFAGTITFGTGTYTSALTSGTETTVLTVPTSCLSGQGLTCDLLSSTLGQADSGETGSCITSGANCVCTLMGDLTASMASGTYTTSGTMITTTPSGAAASTTGYCVQGNTLYVDATSTSTMGGSQVVGQVVFTRQ